MDKYLSKVLDRYFYRLSKTGYIPIKDTESILILYYISQLKERGIAPEEQTIVDKALLCLQGTCVIPYSTCKENCMQ